MRGNRINFDQARRISKETFEAWTRRLTPAVGDLLLAREAPVGPVVRVPPELNVAPGQRTVLLRPDPTVLNSRYAYYLLSSPEQQAKLHVKAEGSTVAHLNVADVRSFELPDLPSLPMQRGIAATLGALDDKIESNRRSVQLIQALGRSIYRSWRFSNSDESNCTATTFGVFAEVFGGATPKTTEPAYWNGDIAWVTPTDMTALHAPYLFGTSRTITESGLASTSAVLHPAGSIFMTSRATIGVFAVNQFPAATNQGFIAVRPREEHHRWFLFEEMRSRVREFLDNANGSTFLELSRGRFKQLPLLVPPRSKLVELDSALGPLHTKAAQLDQEGSVLTKLRDTLIPELLSGRIRAPQIEEEVGE